jgi:hypothetical protein
LYCSVTLEGGQTVTVSIALEYGKGGEARAYVVQITNTDAARLSRQGMMRADTSASCSAQ